MTVAAMPGVEAVLALKESEAWAEYLETTRPLDQSVRYEEVEPWAWARLNRALKDLHVQRQRIENEDGA